LARPLVPDTTAFVNAIRRAQQSFFDAIVRGQIWLSSVVVCELYAGTRSRDEARLLDRLVRGASRAQRLLVPTPHEWTQAGRLIARRIRVHVPLRPRDHLADVLIVVSAGRLSGEILTANLQHFEVWAGLARRAGFDVAVTGSVSPPATGTAT
jgi:predicted nucleic acid-binding protein